MARNRTPKTGPTPDIAPPQVVALEKESQESSHTTIAELIAQSGICTGNFKYPNGETAFKHEPKLHTVDRHYPYAKGGPLLVDAAFYEDEVRDCERKRKVIEASGLRYLVLTRDIQIHEAMAQVEKKWPGQQHSQN